MHRLVATYTFRIRGTSVLEGEKKEEKKGGRGNTKQTARKGEGSSK
jgi:hypothetical protein